MDLESNICMNVDCYVIDDLKHDILLGRDMMDKNISMLDLHNGLIVFHKKRNEMKSACILSCNVILKPHTQKAVEMVVEEEELKPCIIHGDASLAH